MKKTMACLALLSLGCIGINIVIGNYWLALASVSAFICCGGAALLNN